MQADDGQKDRAYNHCLGISVDKTGSGSWLECWSQLNLIGQASHGRGIIPPPKRHQASSVAARVSGNLKRDYNQRVTRKHMAARPGGSLSYQPCPI